MFEEGIGDSWKIESMFKESFGGRGDVGVYVVEVLVWEVDFEGRYDWNLLFCGDFF